MRRSAWCRRRSERGAAIAELALVLPWMLLLLLLVVEFGHLIQTRLIITNVSREGGSIASRELALDAGLLAMLDASGAPLDLAGTDGRIYVTRIEAGKTERDPNPTIATQLTAGGLGAGTRSFAGAPGLGLGPALYEHLVFDADNGTADIAEVTVVEIFYLYRPITPLGNLMQFAVRAEGDGIVIGSRAVF